MKVLKYSDLSDADQIKYLNKIEVFDNSVITLIGRYKNGFLLKGEFGEYQMRTENLKPKVQITDDQAVMIAQDQFPITLKRVDS
jgi:hypothetical protein